MIVGRSCDVSLSCEEVCVCTHLDEELSVFGAFPDHHKSAPRNGANFNPRTKMRMEVLVERVAS